MKKGTEQKVKSGSGAKSGKGKKYPFIGLRLSVEDDNRVRALAKVTDRSINYLINQAIRLELPILESRHGIKPATKPVLKKAA